MHHYGIIGYPLEHSLSAKLFNEKFAAEGIEAEYDLYSVPDGKWSLVIGNLLDTLDGFNVTYPYKQTIIPYLNELDESAKAIGAVNVVYQHKGYNTDSIGFLASIRPLLRPFDKQALVLGTGGASKAVCYALHRLGIAPTIVSRTPQQGAITYKDLTAEVMQQHTLIINCTPLGMFPDVDSYPPIPYETISAQHLLYDCVYNPEETLFLRKGKTQGARIKNGMEMLKEQAKAAWEIWNNE